MQLQPVIKAQIREYTSHGVAVCKRCALIYYTFIHSWQCVLPLGPNPVAHDIDRNVSITIIWLWDGKAWLRFATEARWVYPSLISLLHLPVCCGDLEREKAVSVWLWAASSLTKHLFLQARSVLCSSANPGQTGPTAEPFFRLPFTLGHGLPGGVCIWGVHHLPNRTPAKVWDGEEQKIELCR